MNRKQYNKLGAILCLIVLLSGATGLVLYALKQNINLFYTPTEISTLSINPQVSLRVGGYVKQHSVAYDASGKNVNFIILDPHHEIAVRFNGLLPNLFREGQGVVVTGKLISKNQLIASEVLAKHDEKYVPRYLRVMPAPGGESMVTLNQPLPY
jgi:cytochrome c-type biogenesis protein CcmE